MTDEAQGTTQVEIHEASDADIDAFLESSAAQAEQITEPQEPQEEQSPEAAPEPAPAPEQKDSEPPAAKESEDTKQLRLQVERLQKNLEQSEHFAKRRGNDIGLLRKQLKERDEALARFAQEQAFEDPTKVVEATLERKEIQRDIQRLDVEEREAEMEEQGRSLMQRYVPDGEVTTEDMANSLASDGLGEDYLARFKANPYRSALPETVIQLAKRARAEKALVGVVAYAKAIDAERTKLKAEIARYQKGSPDNVAKRISQELNRPAAMTGATGSSSSPARKANVDISSLSEAELDELIESGNR